MSNVIKNEYFHGLSFKRALITLDNCKWCRCHYGGYHQVLAPLNSGGWGFVAAFTGMTAKIAGNGIEWRFDGTNWIEGSQNVQKILVSGVKVVGAQQPEIVAPTGGTTSDSEARTAISAILGTLRAHGLIAGAQ